MTDPAPIPPASHAAKCADVHRIDARPCGLPEHDRTLVASSTFDALIGTRDELRAALDSALDRASAAEAEAAELRGRLRATRKLKDEQTERLSCQLKRAWTEQHRLETILRAIVLDRYERDSIEKCGACEGTGKSLKQVDALLEGCGHMDAAERVDEFEDRYGWTVDPCPEADCFEGSHIREVSA